jgi:death on curing protein
VTEYLTLGEVLYIHAELIRAFGGAAGARDLGLLESALLRPQTGYYADLIEEAAALWESLAMNHAFVDGNKRVAYAALELFLGLNGVEVTATDADTEAFIYHHLEAGSFRKDVLDGWLRSNTTPGG